MSNGQTRPTSSICTTMATLVSRQGVLVLWYTLKRDGLVLHLMDGPSAGVASNGMAEFKCPFTKADVSPEEVCKDDTFYCTMVNGDLQLSRSHSYYHQVQLQLYVAAHLSIGVTSVFIQRVVLQLSAYILTHSGKRHLFQKWTIIFLSICYPS